MLYLIAQADKLEPLPNTWTMILQAGGLGLVAFLTVYVLPVFLKNLWEDRDKERSERTRREELLAMERDKDRENRHEVAKALQAGLTETHQFFQTIVDKLEDRFDRRLLQAIEQVKLLWRQAPPG